MSRRPIIHIVDDEEHIAELLETNLELDGFETICSGNCTDAYDVITSQKVDLILLDVMLPDGSGIDLCRKIKALRSDIPIIMLSALGQSGDRIRGLKAGADDYLPKPFELEELALRMSNLLERHGIIEQIDIITIGEAEIDFQKMTIDRHGDIHSMSHTENLLLKYMVDNRGKNLSRIQILNDVWGYEQYPNTRTVDNFIATFRKYIETEPSQPKIITTVRGVGYRMD